MNPGITFRPIRPEDQEFLYHVYASTRQDELAPTGWDDAQKEAFLRAQFHAQHTYYQEHYSDAEFSVVQLNNKPIGRFYVRHGEDDVRIVDIALLPEHRRAGIGSSILKDIMDEAACSDKTVSIHVEQFNPALGLYKRLGFTKIGDVGVYYLMKWSPSSDCT